MSKDRYKQRVKVKEKEKSERDKHDKYNGNRKSRINRYMMRGYIF